jgi:hypothetical protein
MGYKSAAMHIYSGNKINMAISMRTAYKFRAYPSKEQKEILNKQMYLSKELYNILFEKSKS